MVYSRQTTQNHWFKKCESCGKEFELKSPHDPFYLCPACLEKNAKERAVREATVLAGATVIAYEIRQNGQMTSSDELESLTLQTTDGRTIKLTADGWDDPRYIIWEEEKATAKEKPKRTVQRAEVTGLDAGGSPILSGMVTDHDTGLPIEGVTVTTKDPVINGRQVKGKFVGTSGPDGKYRIEQPEKRGHKT